MLVQLVQLGERGLARGTIGRVYKRDPELARLLLRTFIVNPAASQW